MSSSGTYAFNPGLVDLVLDAFERCEIRPVAITPDHMFSARRSLNFVYSRWSNRVPNQWLTEEISVPLVDGQQDYLLPAGTVTVLDVFTRNYLLGDIVDLTPALSTLLAAANTVTVGAVDHGLVADQWVNFPIPVAIGGVILSGFYQVVSVPSTSTFTVTVTGTVTGNASGGAVPSYATVAGDATVTVTLAAHGYLPGQTWTVHDQVTVGGITLLGDYEISAVTTNTLTFEAPNEAGSLDTQSENDGEMQYAEASVDTLPQDRYMTPLGRTEWAQLPSKSITSQFATNYWLERLINPVLHIWPIPEITSPMELHYFRMRQIQDGNPQNTETPDVPYRAEEALASALASHLAMKWAKQHLAVLEAHEKEVWAEFAQEDRERVPLRVSPQLGSYYR